MKKLIEIRTNYKYIVLDRLSSSYVYKRLFNRDKPTDLEIFNFENDLIKICKNDIFLVYVYSNIKTIISRIRKRGDNKTTEKYINDSLHLYEEYITKSKIKKIKINTNENIKKSILKIVNFIEDDN